MGERAATISQIELRMRRYAKRIDRALSRELEAYSDSRFYGPLTYAVGGGKRVRPIILLISAEALGRVDDTLLDAAVAVELLHTESIIHDDIIDEEASRRGRVTFHIKYGHNASILTADFVFAMILSIATRYEDRRVAQEISNAALSMSEGEYSELSVDPKAPGLTWDEYMKIISQKTASLFETSARLGAMIAGGLEKEVDALSNFGKFVGIAYQLRDDLLDWGDEDKIVTGLKNSSNGSEIVSKLARTSEGYADRAKKQLGILPDSEAKTFLLDLADFTVNRES